MCSSYGHTCGNLNLFKAQALSAQAADLSHYIVSYRRAARLLVTTSLPSLDALREAGALLLSDSGEKTNDGFPKHARAIKVLLGEGLELHAGRREPLQMIECLGHTLAAEAVEAPEQHYIEASLVSIEKKLLELGSLGSAAAFLVAILLIDGVA